MAQSGGSAEWVMDPHSAKTIFIRQGPNEGTGPTLDVKFTVTLGLGSPGLSPHCPIMEIPPVWSPQNSFFTLWSWQPAYTGPLGKTSDWLLLILWGPCQGTWAHHGLYSNLSAQQLWGDGRGKFNFYLPNFIAEKTEAQRLWLYCRGHTVSTCSGGAHIQDLRPKLVLWPVNYTCWKTFTSVISVGTLHCHCDVSLCVCLPAYLGDPWG